MLAFALPGEIFRHVLRDDATGGSCWFDLRRLTREEERMIDSESTERGNLDIGRLQELQLQHGVVDWEPEGVWAGGKLHNYDRSLIASFPRSWRIELIAVLFRARPTTASGEGSTPS